MQPIYLANFVQIFISQVEYYLVTVYTISTLQTDI